jgi:sortase A
MVATGLLLILVWAAGLGLAAARQAEDQAAWRRVLASTPGGASADVLARPVQGLDFELSVPAVGYDAVVREGVSLDVLAVGPGHYPESAWPGQPGVVGIAAHNVFLLRFDRLRAGDDVLVETRYGRFRYRVAETRVMRPDDTSVLRPGGGRRLALTTCWPLWAGELATRRLAILAVAAD